MGYSMELGFWGPKEARGCVGLHLSKPKVHLGGPTLMSFLNEFMFWYFYGAHPFVLKLMLSISQEV